MRKLPENYEKDEDKAILKAALKACGYGWFECSYLVTATNMKRGVRLVLGFEDPHSAATMKLSNGHLQIRKIAGFNKERTDYMQVEPYWYIRTRNAAHGLKANRVECSDTQDLVEKLVHAADAITGDPAISKNAHKNLLQNLILEDLKKRLRKEQSELSVNFGVKAKSDDQFAVLRIGLPDLVRTDESRSPYGIDELVLYLSDGKAMVLIGDIHGFSRKTKTRQYSIPVFADPAFDPEHIHSFVIATLDRMRILHQHCLDRQDEVDRLNDEICKAKNEERDKSEEFWQSTWFGN